jgi:hypothetical protein
MKSSRAISCVRCLYETDVSRAISVLITAIGDEDRDGHRNVGFIQTPDARCDEDRDGPRNVGFIQTPDAADSPENTESNVSEDVTICAFRTYF